MELSEDVKQLESHLTWMNEIISKLLQEDEKIRWKFNRKLEENGGNLVKAKDYLLKLIVDKYSGRSQESGEDGRLDHQFEANPQNPNYARLIALNFHKLGKSVLIGNEDEYEKSARKELVDEIRETLRKLEGEHERLVEVMEYFLEALEWSMDIVKEAVADNKESGSDDKLKLLKYKWERFHGDDKSRAVILYLKSCVQRELGVLNEDGQLKVLQKIIKMDPEYHIWHLYAYQILRQQRRVFKEEKLTAPSKEEMDFCQKSFDLCPDIVLSKLHLGIMLRDCLWMNVHRKLFPHLEVEPCPIDADKTKGKCLQLFEEAYQLAEGHDLNEWNVTIAYRKAELLLYVSENETDCKKGFNILLKLIKEYPTNAFLHQKLAKVYQFVSFKRSGNPYRGGKKHYFDPSKAKEHLKISIDLRQFNYDICLKDYVKLFKYRPQPLALVKEALDVLSESLIIADEVGIGYLVPKIRIWRGYMIWIYNPDRNLHYKKMAIDDWLHVLEENADQAKDLFDIIWKPPFSVIVSGKPRYSYNTICTDKLTEELVKIRNGPEISWGKLEAVELFLKKIKESPHPDLNGAGIRGPVGPRMDYHQNGSDDKEETEKKKRGSYSGQGQKSKWKGLADQDNNWRRK